MVSRGIQRGISLGKTSVCGPAELAGCWPQTDISIFVFAFLRSLGAEAPKSCYAWPSLCLWESRHHFVPVNMVVVVFNGSYPELCEWSRVDFSPPAAISERAGEIAEQSKKTVVTFEMAHVYLMNSSNNSQ